MSQIAKMFTKLNTPSHVIPSTMKQHGVGGALRLYGDRLYQRYRDRRLSINTLGYLDHAALGLQQEYNEYDPVNYRCIDTALKHLEPISQDDVLLDLGAGKGRVMAEAARYPFGKVMGVEISAQLCADARDNIAKALPRLRCRKLEVVEANALTWEMPAEINRIIMFNPMIGQAMEDLLDNLHASLRAAPRALKIIYFQSWDGPNALDRRSWLRRSAELAVPHCQYALDKKNTIRMFLYETQDMQRPTAPD